ncbi:pilus assembly protein PilM, partial [bacterium]|nr:pilus assembly protein PilM [bacterium]
KRTSMTIYSGNSIVLSISMPISGQSVTDEVAKTLDIKNEQAEKAKILCGFDENMAKGIVGKILSGMLDNLTEKITETNDYFEAHYSELGPLQEIILCGGGSNIKNITKIISEKLNIKTVIGDVFTQLLPPDNKLNKILIESLKVSVSIDGKKDNQSLDGQQNSNLSFATAIGLGLRSVYTDKI